MNAFNSAPLRTKLSRRKFLKRTVRTAVISTMLPTLVPSSVLGANGSVSPSNRVTVACLGTGPQGIGVMGRFLAQPDVQVVAVCDVKSDQLAQAGSTVDQHYRNDDCKRYADFREILSRSDIDACLIASPDHWHVPMAVAAVRAGKDVYVEKPIGCSVAEAQALRAAVLKTGRIFQFGTQQRSDRKFRLACELARNGLLGKLKTVHVWAPGSAPGGSTKVVPVPATLNYDFWLGPAPFKPYAENRCDADGSTKTWWFDTDYALGFIAGWGIHPIDIAIWGGCDLMKGTVEVEGTGKYPVAGACNTATIWDVRFAFNSGLNMIFAGVPNGGNAGRATGEPWPHHDEWQSRFGQLTTHGTVFEGADGWVKVDRGRIETYPEDLAMLGSQSLKVQLPVSSDHVRNFVDAIQTRQLPVSHIQDAVWGDTLCHVADIAARLQRKLKFDFSSERFVDDLEANRRIGLRSMRPPWSV